MKNILTLSIVLVASVAHAGALQPKHVAVLRAGDGVLSLKLKQSPVFIDEFAPGAFNPGPVSTVAIPTNGPNALFFNGHAATEGILSRSADHHLLCFAGYGGVNLLQMPGTPSLLQIPRGFGTVDPSGAVHTITYLPQGDADKLNPRGSATDGANNFWGCGNAFATIYLNGNASPVAVVFDAIQNSRAIRIIHDALYVTLNGPDAIAEDREPGIYSLQSPSGSASTPPRGVDTRLKAELEVKEPYTKIAGFDMNDSRTIAYLADNSAGIQKYVKTNGAWKFAYNFSIPQNIPAADNHATGCFAVVADFSGPNPIIYATTTEGYGGSVNSNRVVQIVDTNATAIVTTIAQAPSSEIVYRGIDLTPEAGK